MRTKPFQSILGLLALLGVAHGNIAPITECTAQAWVRAPDLTPNTIVYGDARVKISAVCPDVETVLLGLRLKERSFIKALRSPENRKWMSSAPRMPTNILPVSPWVFPPPTYANRSDELAFQQTLVDKDSWIVREEERVFFETTQVIHMEGTSRDRDVVQDFSILVPSTNFPPAVDYIHSGLTTSSFGDAEMVNVESIYEYFIRVSFTNGTTKDISTGFTGFQPLHVPGDTARKPASEVLELKSTQLESTATNYTALIHTPSGLIFTEGSDDLHVNVVITRTGPARIFNKPLKLRVCVESTFSSKWAAEYGMADLKAANGPRYALRSTLEDMQAAKVIGAKFPYSHDPSTAFSIVMRNPPPDWIASHEIVVSKTSIRIPVKVDRRHISNFETYYQTLGNSLRITLETPFTDDVVDPDDPVASPPLTLKAKFEDDEEEWVPWEKWEREIKFRRFGRTYTGTVPVVVHPSDKVVAPRFCVHGTDTSGQVTLSGETNCGQAPLKHYLDADARGPTFVDHSVVDELLAEDPAERELRAPTLEPVVTSPPVGEERVFRYNPHFTDTGGPSVRPIYVGGTWAKKVANKGEN